MGLFKPIVVGGFHRQCDQWLMIGEPGCLHVAEDRVFAMGDAGDLKHRGRAFGTGAEGGEFAEWALRRAVLRMDQTFDHDLRMSGNFEIDGVAFDHLDVFPKNSGAIFEFVKILVLAGPVRHDLVYRMEADREGHRHRLVFLDIFHVVGIVVPRRHPERCLLRIFCQHHADDRFVADAGFRVLRYGDAGAQIPPAVTVAVLGDGQGVQIDVLTQHLHFFNGAIIDHHRFAALGGHLFGQIGADLVGVIQAERRSLSLPVFDQDVSQAPVVEAGHVVKHQRPLAFRTQVSHLGQGIHGFVDMQHSVIYGFEECAQRMRHGFYLPFIAKTINTYGFPGQPIFVCIQTNIRYNSI